jgi:peptidoglycan/xylan/chitin deacetylase (PgdA/CDA1 family)
MLVMSTQGCVSNSHQLEDMEKESHDFRVDGTVFVAAANAQDHPDYIDRQIDHHVNDDQTANHVAVVELPLYVFPNGTKHGCISS